MNSLKIFSRYSFMLLTLLLPLKSFAGSLLTSQEFVDIAAVRSISEIETAKIAIERSNSADVKAYAQLVLKEQSSVLENLRKLAHSQRLLMLSEVELLAKARVFVFQRKGKSFDEAYADMRVAERRKVVSLFRDAATMEDSDIRQFATHALPTLMHHLYMAQSLVGHVGDEAILVADNHIRR